MTQAQRVMMIAALSGADPRTVRHYLETGRAHGAHLAERLGNAVRKADEIAGAQGSHGAPNAAPPAVAAAPR